jgi:hypothetical protein
MLSEIDSISSRNKRPAVRELDLADAVVDRAGERAALVAEELALEQRVRKRRAVDRDEAPVLPLALEVDRACGELLCRCPTRRR